MPAVDWSSIATGTAVGKGSLAVLSETRPPKGPASVEGQIGTAENDYIVRLYRSVLLPTIEKSGVEPDKARILELGSGFGRLAYGTLRNCAPTIYVATDVFPELVPILESNLQKWAGPETRTGAAILNPEDPLLIESRSFNIIQSHSVLHHVCDYRTAVKQLYRKLDAPGIVLFIEPTTDGFLFFVTVTRLLQQILGEVSGSFAERFAAKQENLLDRIAHRDDLAYLEERYKHGDKHVLSVHELLDLAQELGARLEIPREAPDLANLLTRHCRVSGASDAECEAIRAILKRSIPPGIEHTMFSHLRSIFCLIKDRSS